MGGWRLAGAWKRLFQAVGYSVPAAGAWQAPGMRLIQAVALARRLKAPVPGAWKAPDPGACQTTI